jgi:two-component system sensor histidine kinase KdpD
MVEKARPTGEQMLAKIQTLQRARLRVYVGAAPGVGKTYSMIEDAHAFRRQGVDVVVGFAASHGRADTEARIADLEVMPRRQQAYRGVMLEEMDLEAILRRKPALCVVDELAHTNVPGSRHEKRYRRRHPGRAARRTWPVKASPGNVGRCSLTCDGVRC